MSEFTMDKSGDIPGQWREAHPESYLRIYKK